jgi:hypothetical protein
MPAAARWVHTRRTERRSIQNVCFGPCPRALDPRGQTFPGFSPQQGLCEAARQTPIVKQSPGAFFFYSMQRTGPGRLLLLLRVLVLPQQDCPVWWRVEGPRGPQDRRVRRKHRTPATQPTARARRLYTRARSVQLSTPPRCAPARRTGACASRLRTWRQVPAYAISPLTGDARRSQEAASSALAPRAGSHDGGLCVADPDVRRCFALGGGGSHGRRPRARGDAALLPRAQLRRGIGIALQHAIAVRAAVRAVRPAATLTVLCTAGIRQTVRRAHARRVGGLRRADAQVLSKVSCRRRRRRASDRTTCGAAVVVTRAAADARAAAPQVQPPARAAPVLRRQAHVPGAAGPAQRQPPQGRGACLPTAGGAPRRDAPRRGRASPAPRRDAGGARPVGMRGHAASGKAWVAAQQRVGGSER